MPKCLKIKASWEIALGQKSLRKKSLEEHPVLRFDLIEITFIAGYCFISNYLTQKKKLVFQKYFILWSLVKILESVAVSASSFDSLFLLFRLKKQDLLVRICSCFRKKCFNVNNFGNVLKSLLFTHLLQLFQKGNLPDRVFQIF